MAALNLPAGRQGQAAAASLAGLALVVVWLGAVSPLLDWYGARSDRITQLAARLSREQALIASLPALKTAASDASAKPTQAVLSGNTDAIAGAALQEQVQGMASEASATLTSIETLPAEQVGAYRRIGVRVEMNAQLGVIVALMRAVEAAEPTMLIDDLHLTAAPSAPNLPPLPMDASFTVVAFRQGLAPTRDDGAKDNAAP